jgi:hypothetical protein
MKYEMKDILKERQPAEPVKLEKTQPAYPVVAGVSCS